MHAIIDVYITRVQEKGDLGWDNTWHFPHSSKYFILFIIINYNTF